MTVGLRIVNIREQLEDYTVEQTRQGISDLFLEVAQKPVWKTKSPSTEIARSPYFEF